MSERVVSGQTRAKGRSLPFLNNRPTLVPCPLPAPQPLTRVWLPLHHRRHVEGRGHRPPQLVVAVQQQVCPLVQHRQQRILCRRDEE